MSFPIATTNRLGDVRCVSCAGPHAGEPVFADSFTDDICDICKRPVTAPENLITSVLKAEGGLSGFQVTARAARAMRATGGVYSFESIREAFNRMYKAGRFVARWDRETGARVKLLWLNPKS